MRYFKWQKYEQALLKTRDHRAGKLNEEFNRKKNFTYFNSVWNDVPPPENLNMRLLIADVFTCFFQSTHDMDDWSNRNQVAYVSRIQ